MNRLNKWHKVVEKREVILNWGLSGKGTNLFPRARRTSPIATQPHPPLHPVHPSSHHPPTYPADATEEDVENFENEKQLEAQKIANERRRPAVLAQREREKKRKEEEAAEEAEAAKKAPHMRGGNFRGGGGTKARWNDLRNRTLKLEPLDDSGRPIDPLDAEGEEGEGEEAGGGGADDGKAEGGEGEGEGEGGAERRDDGRPPGLPWIESLLLKASAEGNLSSVERCIAKGARVDAADPVQNNYTAVSAQPTRGHAGSARRQT